VINDAYSTESLAWHDQATSRDQYARIHDNPFLPVSAANTDHRLSTFSIDVDTASYANVRQFLTQSGMLPPPDAVRIEELVNYFDYDYTPPTGDVPFAANVEVAGCPWAPEHRLVRVGIKGREMERTQRPLSNLVFLIDVSGSMDEPNKLPLLAQGMKELTRELGENDRVAIVVYASSEGLALDSTLGTDQSKILAALDQLRAGGSTAGGAGIQLAYEVAQRNFIKGGVNRVILCTDGDFNVGVTSPAELERMAEANAKETGVFLTVLGFGRGNLNDAMMEQIADWGNGNYHYIDTLVTIAKDVKIQVEFNPAQVAGYRLIGYENRVLAAEDFNDDKKDAGEIGAGHTVTALYEIVPVGEPVASASVDELKYAPKATTEEKVEEQKDKNEPAVDDKLNPASDELLTLKIRYKAPDGDVSTKLEFPINDAGQTFAQSTDDFKFASAVASFGMLLRDSEHKGNATYAAAAEIAEAASKTHDPHGYRQEFVGLVKQAQELSGK
jgi:Ca-activated chloride channel family protein